MKRLLRCMACQDYENIEHIVVDGGSTDGTRNVLKSAGNVQWISEPDNGIYDALNKGFRMATGEIMAWIGSDDLYLPGTLSVVGELFEKFPDMQWMTTCFPSFCDSEGRLVKSVHVRGYSEERLRRASLVHSKFLPVIQQESTFWRRGIWERAGGLDASFQFAADWDLWIRFFRFSELVGVMSPLGMSGVHAEQAGRSDAAHRECAGIIAPWLKKPRPGIERMIRYRAKVIHFNVLAQTWEMDEVRV